MFKFKAPRWLTGFTLTELLVVMAILGFLMTLSVAGIQFALRRSRDIQRQNMVSSLENALNAYYASAQVYPKPTGCTAAGSGWSRCDYAVITTMVSGTGSLANYVQGNWSTGPVTSPGDNASVAYYYDTSSSTPLSFAACILTEDAGTNPLGTKRGRYEGCFCKGPGSQAILGTVGTNRCTGMT